MAPRCAAPGRKVWVLAEGRYTHGRTISRLVSHAAWPKREARETAAATAGAAIPA